MASEQFSLCWDNFHKNMSSGMNSLLESEDLVDVTLAVQGKCLKAHKMVLSVCSPYFKELFKSNPCQHPIVFMKDVSYEALSDLLQFMYQGEVQVSQENLTTFIKTAEALQIKGLTGDGNGSTDNDVTEVVPEKHSAHVEEYKPTPRPKKQLPLPSPMSSPSIKRQRLSMSSNDSQPLPPSLPPLPVTKTEPISTPQPVNIPTEPAAVHFKMEPYDSTQNLIDESGDDNFGEDTLDETVGDDTEDYSMMEGGTGEEEPQAGTSADGAGEGQVLIYKNFEDEPKERIILNGYEFRVDKRGTRPVPWCCIRRNEGCKARFLESSANVLEITRPIIHIHRPTYTGDLDLLSVSIVDIVKRPIAKNSNGLAVVKPSVVKREERKTEERKKEERKREERKREERKREERKREERKREERKIEERKREERKKEERKREERKKEELKKEDSEKNEENKSFSYLMRKQKAFAMKNGNIRKRRSFFTKQAPNFDESLLELKRVTRVRKRHLN